MKYEEVRVISEVRVQIENTCSHVLKWLLCSATVSIGYALLEVLGQLDRSELRSNKTIYADM